ncbi:MAG: peroxiredoxin family protein [Bacteroidia bacterium]
MPYYNSQTEKERASAIKNFVNNNRNSPFAAEAANRLDYLKHTAFLEELYLELLEKFPYSSYVKNMGIKLVDFKAMAVGKEAPELVMPDINGTNYRLSDNKGKHVLVLFSFAFSEPCKNYAVELAPIYHQYSSKGFEVYNVAVDEMEENLQLYLDETKAPWPVVSDLLGQKSTAFDYYIAHDFPMSYMIDDKGNITGKFFTVNDVEDYLKKNL